LPSTTTKKNEETNDKDRKANFVPALLTPNWMFAQKIQVTPLLSRDLTEFLEKEGTMITVVYPPGGSEPIHRHNAHVFVYVLEGAVVMQARVEKEMILTAGQTFYESPNDIRRRSRASNCLSVAMRRTWMAIWAWEPVEHRCGGDAVETGKHTSIAHDADIVERALLLLCAYCEL
jgi:quercetin dioxygenase-like cupin family protein